VPAKGELPPRADLFPGMFCRNAEKSYYCKHAEGLKEGRWSGAKERCGINWGRHGATFCGGIVARRFSDGTPITPSSYSVHEV